MVVAPLPDANSKAPSSLAAALESWEIDEDLRHIERMLKTFAGSPSDTDDGEASGRLHSDAVAPQRNVACPPHASTPASMAWWLQCIGLSAFVCGVALLIWSWLGTRSDLLGIALTATVLGQFGLMIGLHWQRESPTLPQPPLHPPASLPFAEPAMLHAHLLATPPAAALGNARP